MVGILINICALSGPTYTVIDENLMRNFNLTEERAAKLKELIEIGKLTPLFRRRERGCVEYALIPTNKQAAPRATDPTSAIEALRILCDNIIDSRQWQQ